MFGKCKLEFHYTYFILALSYILCGYLLNLVIFTSLIIIHELGHFLVASLFNFRVSKIIIYPYGGITKIDDKLDRDINQELLIACSGILMQFSFYLVICFLYHNNYIRDYVMNLFSSYNNYIIFFNLLPIIPLDGYKIVNLLLNWIFCYNMSNYISVIISFISIIFIIGFNIYNYNYSNIMVFGLVIWYIYSFIRNIKYLYKRFMLEKYLYGNNYKKIKVINNINNMYRNRRHIIYGYIDEDRYLKKIFSDNK